MNCHDKNTKGRAFARAPTSESISLLVFFLRLLGFLPAIHAFGHEILPSIQVTTKSAKRASPYKILLCSPAGSERVDFKPRIHTDAHSAPSAQAISRQPSAISSCQCPADGKSRTTGLGCLGWTQNRRGTQRNRDLIVQITTLSLIRVDPRPSVAIPFSATG
jgi:hypothetical protein